MMLFKNLVLLSCLICWVGGDTLIGYDCASPNVNITPISLGLVKSCSKDQFTPKLKREHVQLLQLKRYDKVLVHSCRVFHSYTMIHCGSGWKNYIVKDGFAINEIHHVSRDDCLKAFQSGTLPPIVGSRMELKGIKANTSTLFKGPEVGDIDSLGYCNTGTAPRDIIINGQQYNGVVMLGSYEVLIQNFYQELNRETGKLMFASGIQFPSDAESGFDVALGDIFWVAPYNDYGSACNHHTHAQVYLGPGYRLSSKTGTEMLIINSTERALALELTTFGVYCGHSGYITDHPRIIALISDGETPFYREYGRMNPEDIDPILYGNAKLAYTAHHIQRQVESLYEFIQLENCDIRYRLLHQLTSLAYLSPEEFAWSYAGTPGVTAVLAGEVIYMIRCHPVAVQFRASPRCYGEIPVTSNNRSMFLKPRSRILVELGTEVPCNPLSPHMFHLDNRWYQLHPTPHEVMSPSVLSSSSATNWSYTHVANLFHSGLYSNAEMEKYQRRLLFPLEKPAIQQVISYHSAGLDVDRQFVNINGLLDEDKLLDMQETIFERVYGWVWGLSMQCAGIFGFLSLLALVRYTINMMINGTLLYQLYGFSYRLLGVVLGSTALNVATFFRGRQTQSQPDVELGQSNPGRVFHPTPSVSRQNGETPTEQYRRLLADAQRL